MSNSTEVVLKSARLANDTISCPDYLGVDKEIDRFAGLIASKYLEPPMSIGLFGKWGLGKSYYMERMMRRVDLMSRSARVYEEQEKLGSGVCKDVLQINFNAWHYADSNIWASLVNRIFEKTAQFLEIESEADKRKRNLFEELDSSRLLMSEASIEIEELQERITEIDAQVEKAVSRRDEVSKKLKATSIRDFYEVLKKDESIRKAVVRGLESMGEELVPDFDQSSVIGLNSLINQYNSTWYRVKSILKEIASDSKWPIVISLFLIFLLILLIPVIFPIIINLILTLSIFGKGLTLFFTILFQLLSATAAFWAVVQRLIPPARTALRSINTGLSYLTKARDMVAKLETLAVEEFQNEVDVLRIEAEELINHRQQLEEEKRRLNEKQKRLQKELEAIKRGERLQDFIERRINSGDYQSRLGLMNTIYNDFKKLNAYMLDNGQLAGNGEKKLERIILYIDDLDRCPPNKGVEVLQAVHLLLSFPLFVLIVGVDLQWIKTALLESEDLLLSPHDTSGNFNLNSGITPRDYLNKIFQIPFHLSELNESDRAFYMQQLTHRWQADEQDLIELCQLDEINFKMSAPLGFSEDEQAWLNDLAPILPGSPRIIKRFLNVYQIIKTHEEWTSPDKPEESKATLLLLAIHCKDNDILKHMRKQLRLMKEELPNKWVALTLETDPEIAEQITQAATSANFIGISSAALHKQIQVVQRFSF